jgi:hypothetical protein
LNDIIKFEFEQTVKEIIIEPMFDSIVSHLGVAIYTYGNAKLRGT